MASCGSGTDKGSDPVGETSRIHPNDTDFDQFSMFLILFCSFSYFFLGSSAASTRPTWLYSAKSALSCLCTVAEDSLLLAGPQIPPTVLSLDYDQAIDHMPVALKQMNLPIMRPTAT